MLDPRLLTPPVVVLVLCAPRVVQAACGDGIPTPGELCLQAPIHVDDDTGAAQRVLTGEFVGPDGNLDVLIARERAGGLDFGGYLGVLPGLGVAGLGTLVKTPFSDFTYGGPRSPSVADFDRDGLDDVVIVERGAMDFISSDYFVELWTSNGDGTFSLHSSEADDAVAVAAGDFDGDGDPDYAVRRGSSAFMWPPPGVSAHGLELQVGNGLGTFTPRRIPEATIPASAIPVLTAGDLDLDGQDDLVTRVGDRIFVGVQFDGNGFTWVRSLADPLPEGLVRLADVNDDGNPDLVYQHANHVVVLPGNGLGGLGAAVQSAIGVGIGTPVALADYDGDGVLDYATASWDGSLWFAAGLGTGAFVAPVMFHDIDQLGLMPSFSLAADVDGDGFDELVSLFADVTPTLDVFLAWSNP